MSNVLPFAAAPAAPASSPVVVSVKDQDGSDLLSYPVVPEGEGANVLMPGFVTGRPDRNRVRAALREALAFLGPDE